MKGFPDLPPIWALGFVATAWASKVFWPIVVLDSPPIDLFGGFLIAAGICVAGWSALWFRRKQTSIEPHQNPTALIVEGPYRINRNPIYSGMTLTLLGIAFWLGALSSIVVAALFPVLVTVRFVKPEEAVLRREFDIEAERYFARTRRW